MDNLATLLETAQKTAAAAGALAREKWSQPRQLTYKGFRDVVTDADVATQKCITDAIRAQFPTHGFLTEEEDSDLPPDGPIRWIIDPIDGTTNYSRQVPSFSVSIAAVDQAHSILVGVIYDPLHDELFSAAAGQGAALNGRPIHVSPVTELAQAIVALDWSHEQEKRQATLEMLQRFAHHVYTIRAIGSAALALAWVAAGRVDGYVNLNLKPWDVAAGTLLIQEAGGQLSGCQPQSAWRWHTTGAGCVASNGRVHDAFLQLQST